MLCFTGNQGKIKTGGGHSSAMLHMANKDNKNMIGDLSAKSG